jgi:hypothetical protein
MKNNKAVPKNDQLSAIEGDGKISSNMVNMEAQLKQKLEKE